MDWIIALSTILLVQDVGCFAEKVEPPPSTNITANMSNTVLLQQPTQLNVTSKVSDSNAGVTSPVVDAPAVEAPAVEERAKSRYIDSTSLRDYVSGNYRCDSVIGKGDSSKWIKQDDGMTNKQCVDKCVKEKESNNEITGVTYSRIRDTDNITCYCDKQWTKPYVQWDNDFQTCLLLPKENKFTSGEYKCVIRYGSAGGSLESGAEHSVQGCLDACLRKGTMWAITLNSANGGCHCSPTSRDDGDDGMIVHEDNKACHVIRNPAIAKWNDLARGYYSGYRNIYAETTRGRCSTKYYATSSGVTLFDIFGDDLSNVIETASREFIKPSHISIIPHVTSFTFSKCEKNTFIAEGILVKQAYKPLTWLELTEDVYLTLEFDYAKMAHGMGDAWNAMKIEGGGFANLGSERSRKNINIYKPNEDGGYSVDADVTLKIDDTDMYWSVQTFLRIFNKRVDDLFPPHSTVFFRCLRTFSFQRSQRSLYVVKVLVSPDKEYHAFTDAFTDAGSCAVLADMEWTLMCQGGYTNDVECVLLATITRRKLLTLDYPYMDTIIGTNLRDTEQRVNLFRHLQFPDTMLFSASGVPIESIIDAGDHWSNIVKENTYNEDRYRVGKDVSEQKAIYPGVCLRFKVNLNVLTYWNTIGEYKDKYMLVMMCLDRNGHKFELLDIGPVEVRYITKILLYWHTDIMDYFGAQKMIITSVLVSDNTERVEITLMPRILGAADGFNFIERFNFILIRENEIKLIMYNVALESFHASGEEEILEAESNFTISMQDNLPAITYTDIQIENNYFLMNELSLAENLFTDEFESESGGFAFKTVFDSMKSITLDNLGIDTVKVGSRKLRFSADTTLGTDISARFTLDLFADHTDGTKLHTRTCVSDTQGGRIMNFINGIHPDFFGESWMAYKQIGVMLLPLELKYTSYNVCKRDVCCIVKEQTNWAINEEVGVKIINLDLSNSMCRFTLLSPRRIVMPPSCTFLRAGFHDINYLTQVTMTGTMSMVHLSAKSDNLYRNFYVSSHLTIYNIKIHVDISTASTQPSSQNVQRKSCISIEGDLFMPGRIFYGKAFVYVSEGNILLKIESETYHGNDEYFFDLVGRSSYSMALDVHDPIRILEMKYDVLFGFRAGFMLNFDDNKKNKQFIEASTKAVIKFYACKTGGFDISSILNAIHGQTATGFNGMTILELCVIYNRDDEPWIIDELEVNAKKGVTLIGVAESTFGRNREDPTRMTLKMTHEEGNINHLCFSLPPQKWAINARYTDLVEPHMVNDDSCWVGCNRVRGKCDFCGDDGYCCRQNVGDCLNRHESVALTTHSTCIRDRGLFAGAQIGIGNLGTWTGIIMCNTGKKVTGFQLRIEKHTYHNDDTTLNGIQLRCSDDRETEKIHGMWGDWLGWQNCPEGTHVSEVEISSDIDDSNDDVGADNLRMKCSNGNTLSVYGAQWGTWQGYKRCPTESYICGVRAKIQPAQGSNDDTALNRIELQCCTHHVGPRVEKLYYDCRSDCRGTGRCPIYCDEGGWCCKKDDPSSNLCPDDISAHGIINGYRCIVGAKNRDEYSMLDMFAAHESSDDDNSNIDEASGPQYCYIVPQSPTEPATSVTAVIKGYIKSFIYKGNAEFQVTSENNRDLTKFQYTGTMTGNLFGDATGIVIFTGRARVQDLHNPSKIEFRLSLQVTSFADEGIEKAEESVLENYGKIMDVGSDARNYLYAERSSVRRSIHNTTTAQKNLFETTKLKRTRAIQSSTINCDDSCGYARFPGWNIDGTCGKTSTGKSLNCMKYVKDINVAKDVGCVALCEAERVKSFAEAKELDAAVRNIGKTVSRELVCGEASGQLSNYIDQCIRDAWYLTSFSLAYGLPQSIPSTSLMSTLAIQYFEAETILKDVENTNCLEFTYSIVLSTVTRYSAGDFVGDHKLLCTQGKFSQEVFTLIYKQILREELQEVDTRFDTLKTFLKKHSRDKGKITSLKDEKREVCKRKHDVQRPSKYSVIDDVPKLRTVDFTLFSDNTVKSFIQSPWNLAQKTDVFDEFQHSQRSRIIQNLTIPETEHACSVARRATIDYVDITNYVHGWIKEHQSAKRTLDEAKKFLQTNVNRTNDNIDNLRTLRNFTTFETEQMQYWMGKAKTGLGEWMSSEDERMKRYNTDSLHLINRELESVYTDDNYKTLPEFFNRRSTDGANAFKKANIVTPTENTFSDISKVLLNVLQNGKSLDEVSVPIEELVKHVERLSKRSVLCVS